jgi:hypothetical protein
MRRACSSRSCTAPVDPRKPIAQLCRRDRQHVVRRRRPVEQASLQPLGVQPAPLAVVPQRLHQIAERTNGTASTSESSTIRRPGPSLCSCARSSLRLPAAAPAELRPLSGQSRAPPTPAYVRDQIRCTDELSSWPVIGAVCKTLAGGGRRLSGEGYDAFGQRPKANSRSLESLAAPCGPSFTRQHRMEEQS